MAKIDKLIAQSQEHLDEGETIIAAVLGSYETEILGNDSIRTGVFLATNKRLVFYAKKMFGYDLEVFPYSNISSIEAGKTLMGRTIALHASGNSAKMKWINEGDIDGLVGHVRASIGKKEAAPVQGGQDDIATQIRKLAQLKDEGLLTEQEFTSKKAELLARL